MTIYKNKRFKSQFSLFCFAGGDPMHYDDIDDIDEAIIHQSNGILLDPEEDNRHLHEFDFVNPLGDIKVNDRQFNDSLRFYSDNKDRLLDPEFNDVYHKIVGIYTNGSNTLNTTLHRIGHGEPVERNILSRVNGEPINIDEFDHLINSSRLTKPTTIYTGSYMDIDRHRGKIAHLHGYTSSTLIPHVAKDFGIKIFDNSMLRSLGYGQNIKHIIKLDLPKGFPHLFAENGTHFPGQMELILPRKMSIHIPDEPSSIITGKFASHMQPVDYRVSNSTPLKIFIWKCLLGEK